MRYVQPTTIDDDAAVYVVLADTGLVHVVGLEHHLAQGKLARPRIASLDGVLRQNRPDHQRRVPKRPPAAGTGFGISPRPAIHIAVRHGVGAAVDRKSTRLNSVTDVS